MARKTNEKKTSVAIRREPLQLVEKLAEESGIKTWELAGLMHGAGWVQGKRVTRSEFDQALSKFRSRPQGGGRIRVK